MPVLESGSARMSCGVSLYASRIFNTKATPTLKYATKRQEEDGGQILDVRTHRFDRSGKKAAPKMHRAERAA
jgi:hypothetical protein